MHRMEVSEAACSDHRFTTTTAAVADEIDAVLYVLAELNEPAITSFLQQIKAFGGIDCT